MELQIKEYLLSDEKDKIQLDRVCQMLNATYWAQDRSRETIAKAIENSICFGIYLDEKQVGFARCVTDYATFYWLADVVVDDEHRGQGLGKMLVDAAVKHELLQGCFGILGTKDAHGLYEQYGFTLVPDRMMRRPKDE